LVARPRSTSAQRSGGSASQQRLLVNSQDGTAALLNARTGAVIWRVASHREVSTLASGDQFFVAFGSRLHLIATPRRREPTEQQQRRHAQIQAEPSWIEARRTQDGALLWRYSDWNLIGYLTMQASSEVLLVSSTSVYGDHGLHAFDRLTGRQLWTYQGPGGNYHVQFGKCYIYRPRVHGGMAIIDMLTGEVQEMPEAEDLTTPRPQWILSPSGRVVLVQRWTHGMNSSTTSVRLLDPETGALLQERSLPGPVRAISDAGIAYCAKPIIEYPGITAVRLKDGAVLWQANEIRQWECVASDSALFSTGISGPGVGHVYAHDAETGRRLWHWHAPDSVRSLLALWGMRTPWLLADSAGRIGSTLAAILAEPAGQRAVTWHNELRQGQWRHPYSLHGTVNAEWLVTNQESVFYGTWLGVFALRASDGKLLWHALPTVDVSFCPPTLTPL
jgi:outer membrane protein assembly factor BamB